jgi:cytochrome d ubiquinol oxidase subunit II
MLPESLTVSQAAATTGTIAAVLAAVGLAVIFVLPSFIFLYTLDQRGLLPGEGVERSESS